MEHDDSQMIVRMHVPDEVTREPWRSLVIRKSDLQISRKLRQPTDKSGAETGGLEIVHSVQPLLPYQTRHECLPRLCRREESEADKPDLETLHEHLSFLPSWIIRPATGKSEWVSRGGTPLSSIRQGGCREPVFMIRSQSSMISVVKRRMMTSVEWLFIYRRSHCDSVR